MKHDDITLCPGGWCPLRYTCKRFVKWMAADDETADLEMDPAFEDGTCSSYLQIEYYGQ